MFLRAASVAFRLCGSQEMLHLFMLTVNYREIDSYFLDNYRLMKFCDHHSPRCDSGDEVSTVDHDP
jgi:hypothetical protein